MKDLFSLLPHGDKVYIINLLKGTFWTAIDDGSVLSQAFVEGDEGQLWEQGVPDDEGKIQQSRFDNFYFAFKMALK